MKDIRIAIDGPASSGKSTVAKIIAKNLGYTYLDTGAMYRSATYLALQNGLTEENVRSEERRVGKECRSRWSPYH